MSESTPPFNPADDPFHVRASINERKNKRFKTNRAALLIRLDQLLLPAGEAESCGAADLSRTGACVTCASGPNFGDRVLLAIEPDPGDPVAVFAAEVVDITMVQLGFVRVGVRFIQPPKGVQSLIESLRARMQQQCDGRESSRESA